MRTSEILNITDNFFRGEFLSKTIVFADDTSITIDELKEVSDYDGMITIPNWKLKAIEQKLNIKIKTYDNFN